LYHSCSAYNIKVSSELKLFTLEAVFHKFSLLTISVSAFQHLKTRPVPYPVTSLQATPLEKRRFRGDLIQVLRIVKGFDLVNIEDFFELDDGGEHALRGHKWKLKIKRNRLQLRKCFFSQRVISSWNPLPGKVVDAASVNSVNLRSDWTNGVQMWKFKLCFCPQSHKLKVNFKAPFLGIRSHSK